MSGGNRGNLKEEDWSRLVYVILIGGLIFTFIFSHAKNWFLLLGAQGVLIFGTWLYYRYKENKKKNRGTNVDVKTKFTVTKEQAQEYHNVESKKLYAGCRVFPDDKTNYNSKKRGQLLNGSLFADYSKVFVTQYKSEQSVVLMFVEKLKTLNRALFEKIAILFPEEYLTKTCILTNRIEGLVLPEEETAKVIKILLQREDLPATFDNLTSTQLQAIKNYYEAWQICRELHEEYLTPLTLDDVIRVHTALCPSAPGLRKNTKEGTLITNSRLLLPRPEEVEPLTHQLLDWLNDQLTKGELHILDIVINFQARFLRILPFKQANGEVARLLTSVLLLKNRMFPLIMSSMSPVEYKEALSEWFNGNPNPFGEMMWIEFDRTAMLYM
eukprot:TRINITY_DN7130_c0_g1_i1.p1 TRINITY_DN7130_c0_g1~~TRINITY_DN7130_c0_g1_i1.p1  ORF type:complete len:383 (-),score=76.17 TRINITY_DN7130_c0_g1_i1:32-1180(-)